MSKLIEEFVTNYQARKRTAEPMEKALRLATSAPQDITKLVQAVMQKLPEGGTFLDAALAFLPDADWPELVSHAVTYLQAKPNAAAESVITNASLQCVQAVHPFLAEMFMINQRFDSYIGSYAWRESGTIYLNFLAQQLHAPQPPISDGRRFRAQYVGPRALAISALLETRHPDALGLACDAAPDLGHTSDQVRANLLEVDCERVPDGFRNLTSATVRHLQFPAGYVERSGYLKDWVFPTWETLVPNAYRYRFGGTLDTTCGRCHQPLHHLLTLDPVPDGLGITSVPTLSLATCISCLGWEVEWLFFQHDVAGQPCAYSRDEIPRSPQFLTQPLLETQVAIVDTPRRWHWQEYNVRENLHRLGGHPSWQQWAQFPACPRCEHTMPFLMQLDSELRLADGNSLLWGDAGIAYLFWCDACRISATMWQCT